MLFASVLLPNVFLVSVIDGLNCMETVSHFFSIFIIAGNNSLNLSVAAKSNNSSYFSKLRKSLCY